MQASPAEHRSFLWSPPGKRVAVDLHLAVVQQIASEIAEMEDAAGRSDEVGGLLLGRTRREGGQTIVEVEAVESLECEHAAGPSFMLSAPDRQALEAALRRRKGSVVGFYRSNTRREFAITLEDVALLSSYFADASKVLLLVHAARGEALRGGFVVWESRSVPSKSPTPWFPFDPATLSTHSHVVDASPTPPEPVTPDARGNTALPALPAPRLLFRKLNALREWGAVAAAAAVILAAGALWDRGGSEPPRAVAKQAAVRSAPELAGAAAQKEIPAAISEADATAPEPTQPAPGVAPAEPPAIAEEPSLAPPPAEAAAVPSAHASTRSGAVSSASADRKVLELPPAAAPPAAAVLEDPPEAPRLPPGGDVLVAGLAAVAPPPPVRTVKPAAPPVIVALDYPSAPSAKFTPPSPLRQERPVVPAALRSQLTRDVLINVKVYVDRAGRVEFAELLSNGTGANRDLAALAVFASRKWQFSPAQQGGKAVPGQAVLRFRFAPWRE